MDALKYCRGGDAVDRIDVGAREHLRRGASNRARCDTSASSACSRFVDGLPERRPGERLA